MEKLIFDKQLTEEQFELIKKQYQLCVEFANSNISNKGYMKDENNTLILEEGTLIHGTIFDKSNLLSISQKGILACEFLGNLEDSETFYCADFFRINKTQSMGEYTKFCFERETVSGINMQKIERGYLPVVPQRQDYLGSGSLAFIVNNNFEFNDLLKYDAYRNTNEAEVVRDIVNWKAINDDSRFDKNRLSAILVGIPPNCLSGILVGDGLKNNKENISFLIELFPHCYITTINGEILYSQEFSNKKQI